MAGLHPDNTGIRASLVTRPADVFQSIFADALIVMALDAAALLSMFLPVVSQSILRFGLAIVLFMFLPGYALVAAVYPGRNGPGGIERLALSAGMSLVVSPLIGFALNFSSFGVRALPMALGVSLFVVTLLGLALRRRLLMPSAEQFRLDLASPVNAAWTALSPGDKKGAEKTATIMLLASLGLVIITVLFLAAVPVGHEQYTELYLYGKNATIAEYPLGFTLGETKPVIVGVSNHEGSAMAYNLAVTIDGIGSQRHQIYSGHIVLADNQTMEKAINLTPDRSGNHMNMVFLLYVDGIQDTPYRSCNLWIDVAEPMPVDNNTAT